MDLRRLSVCLGCVVFLFGLRSEENISLGKTATQSSELSGWKANAAVDGCVRQGMHSGCCSHTASTGWNEAWWQVDLGSLSTISYIKIYYRGEDFDSRHRFAGYQLYLSNTTNWSLGVLCYKDQSSTKDEVDTLVTHQCPYVAQYVTVYNYRNNTKRHDWYDDYAVLELCEVQVFGCPIKKHGNGTCDQTCPDSCYGGNCEAATGSCFYCPSRKHGQMCDLECSSNCKDFLCDKDTGYCEACVPRKYGNSCEYDCSSNCRDSLCAKDSHCYECIQGKYGNLCEQDCSSRCKDGLCAKDTGHCDACVTGKYDDFCSRNCPNNCLENTCEKNNGHCLGCIPGKYGVTCDLDCSEHCNNSVCIQSSGQCKECVAGKYGSTCEQNCPLDCKDNVCSRNEGKCLNCSTGRYGETCTFTCPVTCKDFVCDQQTGQCLAKVSTEDYKLIAIVLAVICGLMLAVLVTLGVCHLVRKNKDKTDSSDKNIELSSQDPNYSSLSGEQKETPNVYEMIVT